jgi:hypothetical protein
MLKAQVTLKEAGWKDCSAAHLKQIIRELNEQDACESPCGKG